MAQKMETIKETIGDYFLQFAVIILYKQYFFGKFSSGTSFSDSITVQKYAKYPLII